MTDASADGRNLGAWLSDTLDSAVFARAFTLAVLGATVGGVAITRLTSTATYITFLAGLGVVGAAILARRRREIDVLALVPLTLVVFLAWALVSAVWSTSVSRTLGGWVLFALLAFLALVIAQVRDTLQTVRAVGDVLRVALVVSLALEVLSGILIDQPFERLGITGAIAFGGPIQGIFGTRNLLGLVAVIAAVTFATEWRAASLRRPAALASIALAVFMAVLSASPTVVVLAAATALAAGVLALVRVTPEHARPRLQWVLAAIIVVGAATAYVFRRRIIGFLGAGSDFATRAELWDTLLVYARVRGVQGWGFFGGWAQDVMPFDSINAITRDTHASALNAFLDVQLQLGLFGLALFAAFCGIALVRAWLVASTRRSVLYAWTPLVLIVLLVDSAFESFTLWGFPWLMLVLCAARAGMTHSWRGTIAARRYG